MTLHQIRQRWAAVSEGPWIVHDMGVVDQARDHIHPDRPWWWVWQKNKLPFYGGVLKVEDYGEGKDGTIGEITGRDIPQQWADATAIAHAPEDVAALIGALDAILVLHRPVDSGDPRILGDVCAECSEVDDYQFTFYPCPTVEAVGLLAEGSTAGVLSD